MYYRNQLIHVHIIIKTYFDIKSESILKIKFYKYIYLQIKILSTSSQTLNRSHFTCNSDTKFQCSQ